MIITNIKDLQNEFKEHRILLMELGKPKSKVRVVITNGERFKFAYFDNLKRGKYKFDDFSKKEICRFVEKSGLQVEEIVLKKICSNGNLFYVKTKCGKEYLDYGAYLKRRFLETGFVFQENPMYFRDMLLKFENLKFLVKRKNENINLIEMSKGNYPNIKFEYGKRIIEWGWNQFRDAVLDKNKIAVKNSFHMYKRLELLGINNIEILSVYLEKRKSNENKSELYLDIKNKDTGEIVSRVQWRRMYLNGHSFSKSTGETEVEKCLLDLGVEYEKQKTFENCVFKTNLRFDFYIPSINTCLEYDGEYHYHDIRGTLEYTKIRDNIKNKFCEENNINLIRIPYFEKHNIRKIIEDIV